MLFLEMYSLYSFEPTLIKHVLIKTKLQAGMLVQAEGR